MEEFTINTNHDERWVVVLLIIEYGLYNFAFIGYPIYFMKPNMLCSNTVEDPLRKCSYNEAC